MTKAVSYVRVSTDRQGKSGLGLEAQQAKVKEMAREKGLGLEKEYREVQSGKSRKRPQLEKALQYCKVTGALLLVPKIDRLARDAAYLMSIYDSGIEVHFGDMPNASGSAGRLMLQMMSSIAEYEGRRISERTKEALAVAKKRGTKLGGYRGAPPPDWKLSVKTAAERAGLEKVTFYTLRHTCASWLAQQGAASLTIRDILGHTSIRTTDRYLHSQGQQLHQAVAVLRSINC